MFEFLRACIEARLNLFVSGGTGSGKTTTLNVLSSFIPDDERIVTIEDAAELQLRQDHVITLEARPPNLEGEGEITIRNLLRNAMHMRPDRIIVGECRAGEALDMLQAMTTGHDGSLSTGHANTPKDMLRRLETMVLMTGYRMPLRAIREQIAVRRRRHRPHRPPQGRPAQDRQHHRGLRDRGRRDPHPGHLLVRPDRLQRRQDRGIAPADRRPAHLHAASSSEPAWSCRPASTGSRPRTRTSRTGPLKSRFGARTSSKVDLGAVPSGDGRTVVAGGMVYISSIGPVDPETGVVVGGTIKEQTRRAMANLQERLEGAGSSLENVVWANWSLKDPSEFDEFNDEWNRWFPGDAPLGQCTIMPPLQRRAGFGVSLGVIATL